MRQAVRIQYYYQTNIPLLRQALFAAAPTNRGVQPHKSQPLAPTQPNATPTSA